MDQTEAIRIAKAYKALLDKHFPNEKVLLFGSYAKNTFNDNSDIDLAIVVDRVDADYFNTNPLLWKLRRQIDDRIEPVLIEKDFDDAGFLDDIQKYAIEII